MKISKYKMRSVLLLWLPSALATRTLFLGNSYTYYNGGVEKYYASMVNAHRPADQTVTTEAIALPNYFLRQHVADGQPASDGEWTHLVLQEQSQAPGFPASEPMHVASKEACVQLATAAYINNGVRCFILLQTWGRRDGDSQNPELFPDFQTMQSLLSAGYESLADEVRAALRAQASSSSSPSAAVDVRVAPAGEAFGVVLEADPELFRSLYHADGAHPSVAGSYLMACVVTCTLHRELKPEDLSTASLPPELDEGVAQRLRDAASAALEARHKPC